MTIPRAGRAALLTLVISCAGPESAPEPAASWLAEPLAAIRTTTLIPGPENPPPKLENPYLDDAGALAQGAALYQAFNCGACHGGDGGGAIGPPFADDDWIYGGSVANIYASIIQGRPNGMPAFGVLITGEPVWKLAAYVRAFDDE